MSVDKYLDNWMKPVDLKWYFNEGASFEYQNEPACVLLINDDRKKWRKYLGISLLSALKNNKFSFPEYQMLMDSEFLIKQPADVRTALLKGKVDEIIFSDENLSEEEKISLLIDMPCAGLVMLKKYRSRCKSEKTFVAKYSKILELYKRCLEKYLDRMIEHAGEELSDTRFRLFYSLLKIYGLLKEKNESLVLAVEKDISMINILQVPRLLKLANAVYGIGLHKIAKRLQHKVLDLWNQRKSVSRVGNTEWVDFILTMRDAAKRVNAEQALTEINKAYGEISPEIKFEYVSKNEGYPDYRVTVVKDIYWDILQYVADYIDDKGYEQLLYDQRFEELCYLGFDLSALVDDEDIGYFRMRQYFENLCDVTDELPRRHNPSWRRSAYFKYVYRNQIRYDQNDVYTGGKYILLAELILGKDKAKAIFDEIEGSVENHSATYQEMKNYLCGEE